jgi:hypothetical protein
MKIALAAVVAAGALAGAPSAWADESSPDLRIGQAGTLVNGDVVQTWTINGLKPSGDAIPAELAGSLWEATATNAAVAGSVIPVIPNFNARGGGDNYRVLFGVATAQGVNPATLAQGEKASGKIYFDVTGANPDRIVYNDGETDRLVWVNAPEPVAGPPSDRSVIPQSPAGAPNTATPAQNPAAGSQGSAAAPADTPAATSQGTPAATSQGTPAGTPAPAAGTPAATSQGTPAAGAGTPAATSQGTPAGTPAPAAGTPAAPVVPTTVSPSPTPAATSAG